MSASLATTAGRDWRPAFLPLVVLFLVAAMLASVLLGPARVTPAGLLATLADLLGLAPLPVEHARDAAILGVVRAPRVLMAALVGAGLGVAGRRCRGYSQPSGRSRADRRLRRRGAGGGRGDRAGRQPIRCGGGASRPLAAAAGGLGATLLMARLGAVDGVTAVATLLLAGVAVNALAGALTGVLIFMADDRQVRDITFWTLGSLAGSGWAQVPVVLLLCGLPTLLLCLLARPLNALLLGEAEAFHLGTRIEAVKRATVVLSAIAVAAGVAFTGLIGFIGLVVPHLVRLAVGSDHKLVLPGAALLGAALLVLADLLARSLAALAELPVGVVTALLGAPFFLWLLRRSTGGGGA